MKICKHEILMVFNCDHQIYCFTDKTKYYFRNIFVGIKNLATTKKKKKT